jgi:quercetin dioxygenase-like cupin family protein
VPRRPRLQLGTEQRRRGERGDEQRVAEREPGEQGDPGVARPGDDDDPLKIDVAPPSQLTVQEVTIQPGGVAPWHTHPGAENTVVTAGQLTLTIATDPGCAPRHLGPGQAFDIPANTPHTARNDGSTAVTLFVTYLGNQPGATLVNPVARPSGCSS